VPIVQPMKEVAYRLVPCDEEGQPCENSQYTTITTERLDIGTRIDLALFGYTTWEVVEVRSETGPLLGARDRFGNKVPLAGTLICRGTS
jgi:hypothetical protein